MSESSPKPVLNQYAEKSAAFCIDGYFGIYLGDPSRNTPRLAFEHAKQESVAAMHKRISELNALSFERWLSVTKCCSARIEQEKIDKQSQQPNSEN